jgi:hypothetical protein
MTMCCLVGANERLRGLCSISMEQWWNENLQGGNNNSEKILIQFHFVQYETHMKSSWIEPETQ